MKLNYVLIDYENVQPKDLTLLQGGPFQVKIFLGPNQSKIPTTLATVVQPLGRSAEYIPLEASGSNALDFHIAYYLGTLSSHDPAGHFHIISRDTGFDPLIKHLRGKGVFAHRSENIAGMPIFNGPAAADHDVQVQAVVTDLARRKTAKPRTQKALLNLINAQFKNDLTEPQLSALVASLCKRGVIQLDGAKVSYSLPA